MTRRASDSRWPIDVITRLRGSGPRRIAQTADIVLERGQGSYVYSNTGRRYLDLIAGHGVAALGHCHPRWVEAVVGQARRLTVTPLHTAEWAEYLQALAGVLPPRVARAALFSTGAESVEAAIRLAQTASGRPGVLTFEHSFHGKTLGVRYAGDLNSPEARLLGPDWLQAASFPACERHDAVEYGDCEEPVDDLIATLAGRADLAELGAVLVEPVLGTAGNIPPRRPFLPELRRLCDARGWLLVLDESITGFGRTGELFAASYFAVEPDVLVLGKGMGGGLPFGAVCASAELWESSALSSPSATSSSFGGNPLACVAGLATLEIVASDDFLETVRGVADHAARSLRQLADASPAVGRPRGVGLMLGFDLLDPDDGGFASADRCAAVFRACRDRGVLLLADVPRVRLSPPLTIARSEIDELFGVLHEVLV
jgi:4-aminobutyrate aminotransferase-like enzyme